MNPRSIENSSSAVRPTQPAWRALIERQPLWSACATFVIYLTVSTALGLAAIAWFPQFQPEFVALLALSVLVALALTVLGWWRAAGFNLPAEWRAIGLLWFPFAVVLILPFLMGIKTTDWGTFFYLVVGYALTGFMEEGLMRGIVLRMLKPLGVNRSVVISSLLFGLMHVGNLLYRNPLIVLAQMVGAFVHGVGLASIRLRTNTIWFVVVLHALHDLFLQYSNFPIIPLDVVQVTLLMLYGLYLLRSWKGPDRAQYEAVAPRA